MTRMFAEGRWALAGRGGVLAAATAIAAACGAGSGGGAGGKAEDGAADPAAAARETPRPAPGMAWVVFGADTILAEVASLPEQRERGLMNRDSVPDGTGMLFVFPESEERSFWMRDTRVPLDLACFDETLAIVSISRMQPLDETLIGSGGPTAVALEVRQGWFAERGIEVGARAKVVFGPGMTVR
ncbi:MAG: DUF192 domain-containing protein [Gemmatimonadota bacterium]|nr:DUF192 domain-containing protein [Gemmatimonadota bacterium]MDE2873212.1 DUF192 domain-containing protein [Gemmatimonadota bacterium]